MEETYDPMVLYIGITYTYEVHWSYDNIMDYTVIMYIFIVKVTLERH